MGGKPIYIKPSITDIPKPLYERIYNTIRNTPYPDFTDTDIIVKKTKDNIYEARKNGTK